MEDRKTDALLLEDEDVPGTGEIIFKGKSWATCGGSPKVGVRFGYYIGSPYSGKPLYVQQEFLLCSSMESLLQMTVPRLRV